MSIYTKPNRRLVLQGLAATAAAGIAINPVRSLGQSNFDWKRFAGEEVNVSLLQIPHTDLVRRYLPEFEELTGIKVNFESTPEQQQRQKLVIELAARNPTFDVTSVALGVQKRMIGKAGWMQDLREWIEDPTLTAPEFDFSDFSPGVIEQCTQADGRLDSLSEGVGYHVLYMNRSMFEEKGVPVPTNYDELVAAAEALHDPANGVSGMVARGIRNANTIIWTGLLLGWGKEAIDPDLTFNTNTPEAIEAASLYQTLLRDYGPEGVVGFNWNEAQTLFQQGRAAMWSDTTAFAASLEDPAQSPIAGNVAYAVHPAGPVAHRVGLFTGGISIPVLARNKGPAWYFMQWMLGKDMMAKTTFPAGYAPPRQSVIEAVKGTNSKIEEVGLLQVMEETGPLSYPALPSIIPVTEFRDIYGVALTNMIGGADPEAELAAATEQFKPILERSEQGG